MTGGRGSYYMTGGQDHIIRFCPWGQIILHEWGTRVCRMTGGRGSYHMTGGRMTGGRGACRITGATRSCHMTGGRGSCHVMTGGGTRSYHRTRGHGILLIRMHAECDCGCRRMPSSSWHPVLLYFQVDYYIRDFFFRLSAIALPTTLPY